MTETMPPLTLREKVGYGFGDAASSMLWKIFGMYLMFFYTDIFGIPAAVVGTLLLVTRVGDAALEPLVGILGDRTHTLEKIQTLSALGGVPSRLARGTDFHHPRTQHKWKNSLCVCNVLDDDAHLLHDQCSLCLTHGRHDR